jgi:putative hydrolase of the HAD superfamily
LAAALTGRVSGILFDAGGVLVVLDGMTRLRGMLGPEVSHDEMHERWLACPSMVRHETGQISLDEFTSGIVGELGLAMSASEFLDEFTGWLKGPIPGAFDLVQRIPAEYRVAILSNMSALHWKKVQTMPLPRRIESAFVSCETGVLKPAPEAFLRAAQGMGLEPGRVLFLDDGGDNVAAARSLGFEAHVVRTPDAVESVLHEYSVI